MTDSPVVFTLECGGLTPLFSHPSAEKRRQAAALQSRTDPTPESLVSPLEMPPPV